MAILEILTYPDEFLRKPTRPVTDIDEKIQTIIEDMADTMYEAPGVGLAAIQAGIDQSIIVYDAEADARARNFQVLINPEIVASEGSMVSENEGCLSVPDFRSDVERYATVTVTGMDRNGKPVTIEADGILSVILQHEIDHLRGVLFIDRISVLKRQLYKKRRQKELKQSAS